MEIRFSRHAKRRARLYQIPESVILDTLAGIDLQRGEHEIVKDVSGFEYPLKIIVSVEGNTATVVTSYPLKKGREK